MKILCVCVFVFAMGEALPPPIVLTNDGLSKVVVTIELKPEQSPIPSPKVRNGTDEEIPFVSFLPASTIENLYNKLQLL
ncbi:hypothetical protein SFRURICE_019319 [Spodoptera frugiperda]|nr:hypothetical protein SFRURICE_019319 [Spodoptera frugiperda]